jgi:dsDNA-binding SOS-regulon protein
MITNERQYVITKAEADRFELALNQADEQNKKLHPKLRKAALERIEAVAKVLGLRQTVRFESRQRVD